MRITDVVILKVVTLRLFFSLVPSIIKYVFYLVSNPGCHVARNASVRRIANTDRAVLVAFDGVNSVGLVGESGCPLVKFSLFLVVARRFKEFVRYMRARSSLPKR